ncbi:MAG: PP2C family protein-serine/threonine phosphatase [Erythrobacter sp.]
MSMRFHSASTTHVGLKRKINEDNLLDRSEHSLWVVADGMGGHEAGEVASAKLVEALANLPADGSPETAAKEAERLVQGVNRDLLELAQGSLTPRTIGSTVVVLAIRAGEYRCLWAGDSRCYLVRDRQITQLTHDHSLVDDLVRSGMIKPEEAAHHPDANVITRAVGATRELRVDCVAGEVRAGDHFLLASDGVTRVIENAELGELVISRNPVQAVEEIQSIVLSRGAPDNLTCIIVRVL